MTVYSAVCQIQEKESTDPCSSADSSVVLIRDVILLYIDNS